MPADKPKTAEVTVKGSLNSAGNVSGEGTLTLSIADAAKAGLSITHTSDGTTISLSSSKGIEVGTSSTLTLHGAISKDLKSRFLEGEVRVDLTLPKAVEFSISHSIKPGSDTTSVSVTITF